MFRSAIIKLTFLYLLIIMVISFFFSLNLYRISGSELDYNLSRQQNAFQKIGRLNPMMPDGSDMMQIRQQQIDEGKQRILLQLIYTNIFILFAGGGISYLLARMTLKPIEEAHEAQSRFTGDASHELRSPLAVMKSEIEVALRDPNLSKEEATEILRSNLEEVDRLKALSEGLLALANGKDKLDFENINVEEIISQVESNFAKQLIKNKVKLVKDLEANLAVFANESAVVELLGVLLDNAIKYGSAGKEIEVMAKKSGKQALITVTDHGQGIAEKDLPHVFDRFYRAEQSRTRNSASGHGLGLSIAKKLAEKNHGNLEVESTLGEGTTFKLFLRLS